MDLDNNKQQVIEPSIRQTDVKFVKADEDKVEDKRTHTIK